MGARTVGILAFHGDVSEHTNATLQAAKKLKLEAVVRLVRTKEDLGGLDALIIPGGESTTLQKLCEREGMFEGMKKIPNIFGTCAGAILLAKSVNHRSQGQKTLERMNIEVDRNAYGRQSESFEKDIATAIGNIHAIFIRAPKITHVGKGVETLAKIAGNVVACEQQTDDAYYLATCFHPECTSTMFHEHFLRHMSR